MAQIDRLPAGNPQARGSDLHFIAGDPPRIRRYGELSPLRRNR
jgi:Tfp pilus assembly pilus retraction ATPase PilT